jgi:dCMP deaminase
MNVDKIYLSIVKEASKLSKCRAFHMAAAIVKNGKLISIGINGSPSGAPNCCDIFPEFDSSRDKDIRKKHHEWSDKFEIHAELNAILNAASNGISVNGATMYITNLCCFNCLKHIIQSGIIKIIYEKDYDHGAKGRDVEELLKLTGVELIKIDV